MSWATHLKDYEEYLLKRDASEVTVGKYMKCVEHMLKYMNKYPDSITQKDVDEYRAFMKKEYENSAGY